MTDQVPPPPPDGFPPPPPPGFGAPPAPGFGAPPPGYAPYGAGPAPVGPSSYAGFGSRLGAFVIDGFITALFGAPAWIALVSGPTRIEACTISSSGDITGFGDDANGLCEVPTGGTIAIAVVLGLAALVGVLLYHGKLEGGPSGQTIGKKALGIKVVDAATGGPIGTGRAIGRFLFASIISGSICYLGYLWNLWDSRKQTWHDKVTTAVVVKS